MANLTNIEITLDAITEENLAMENWARSKGSEEPKAACGTTMCFAGHAVVQAGHEIKWEPIYGDNYNEVTDEWEDVIEGWEATYLTDGRQIVNVAQDWLDLTYEQREAIFMSTDIGSDVPRLKAKVHSVIFEGDEEVENDV